MKGICNVWKDLEEKAREEKRNLPPLIYRRVREGNAILTAFPSLPYCPMTRSFVVLVHFLTK